jgi:aminopeptidase-like protein
MYALASRLYPICRSITGQGVRETLAILGEHLPLEVRQVPSGTAAYDWEVPLEWNVEDAAVVSPTGERVVDFQKHNLHLVSYSEPVSRGDALSELQSHLHSLPDQPAWTPYRTSYYKRNWGFCLPHVTRVGLQEGTYHVEIGTSLRPGYLTYGELAIPGESRDEVLFVTHVCHPSLANDNTAGMAVACALATWLASERRRYTYRFVFAPGDDWHALLVEEQRGASGTHSCRTRAGPPR